MFAQNTVLELWNLLEICLIEWRHTLGNKVCHNLKWYHITMIQHELCARIEGTWGVTALISKSVNAEGTRNLWRGSYSWVCIKYLLHHTWRMVLRWCTINFACVTLLVPHDVSGCFSCWPSTPLRPKMFEDMVSVLLAWYLYVFYES